MVDRRTEDTDERSSAAPRRFTQAAGSDRRGKIDEHLELLSDERRRDVLYYLSDHELASVEAIATAIAAREADVPTDLVSPDLREPILIDLYHNQLPKLTDSRLVEYDRRSGAIRWTAPTEDVEALLECCHALETDDSTPPDDSPMDE